MSGPFTLDLQAFIVKAKGNADEVVCRVVGAVVSEVDFRSPVDTGRFRGNWQLGVDTVPGGTTKKLDPTGEGVVARNLAIIPDEAGGHIYSLTNNLPYALPLEHGWSQQAPQGMVGLTVEKFKTIVAEAVQALHIQNAAYEGAL